MTVFQRSAPAMLGVLLLLSQVTLADVQQPLVVPSSLVSNGESPESNLLETTTNFHVAHTTFEPNTTVYSPTFLGGTDTLIVQLFNRTLSSSNSFWQFNDAGSTWTQLFPDEHLTVLATHAHFKDRTYIFTNTTKVHYTTDSGRSWESMQIPKGSSGYLSYHPTRVDYLITTATVGCETHPAEICHYDSYYTTNHGRMWNLLETYVDRCYWGLDFEANEIMCEGSWEKKENDREHRQTLTLKSGSEFFSGEKKVLLESVAPWSTRKIGSSLLINEFNASDDSIRLHTSADGKTFSRVILPEDISLYYFAFETYKSTASSSLFLNAENRAERYSAPKWSTLLKSNANGTVFHVSAEYVYNDVMRMRDSGFELVKGVEGLALINVVTNTDVDVDMMFMGMGSEALKLQSRLSFDDGDTWNPINAPPTDMNGIAYYCRYPPCQLHLHTLQRSDYSSRTRTTPSIPGLILAAGTVGDRLGPYFESDMFLSLDNGHTWKEIYRGPHIWSFGVEGRVWVMAHAARPTSCVVYSLDGGRTWVEYRFLEGEGRKVRVVSLERVPGGSGMEKEERFVMVAKDAKDQKKGMLVRFEFLLDSRT